MCRLLKFSRQSQKAMRRNVIRSIAQQTMRLGFKFNRVFKKENSDSWFVNFTNIQYTQNSEFRSARFQKQGFALIQRFS